MGRKTVPKHSVFAPSYIFYAPDTRSNVTTVWFCPYATALLIMSELVQLW